MAAVSPWRALSFSALGHVFDVLLADRVEQRLARAATFRAKGLRGAAALGPGRKRPWASRPTFSWGTRRG